MTEATPQALEPPARSEAWSRLATERGLFTSAVAVVGLHVADDNFLQPEPGTSPADHLPGGLVPLALLVGAAWAYPRLRAGARAALALLFGFLGVLAASRPSTTRSRTDPPETTSPACSPSSPVRPARDRRS